MTNLDLFTIARRVAVPFLSGAFFFLALLGAIAAFETLVGKGYAMTNRIIYLADFQFFNFVLLAVLIGETAFGWKIKRAGHPTHSDIFADLAQCLAENLYFLLGIGFGLFWFSLLLTRTGHITELNILKVISLMIIIYPLAWGIEIIRNVLKHANVSGIRRSATFGAASLVLLIYLGWLS